MEDYCSGSTIDVGYYDQIRLKLTGGSSHSLNWQCQVLLNTDFDSQMMLYFKDMNIPSSYSCQYNFLEIDDGSSRSSPYIAGKFYFFIYVQARMHLKALPHCLLVLNRASGIRTGNFNT